MNNENLKTLTPSEAREQGRRGGIASGEARRRKKTLRNELLALLEDDATRGAVCGGLIEKAMKGDARAFQILRDSIGEVPESRTAIRTTSYTVEEVAEEPGLGDVLRYGITAVCNDNPEGSAILDCFSIDAIKNELERMWPE